MRKLVPGIYGAAKENYCKVTRRRPFDVTFGILRCPVRWALLYFAANLQPLSGFQGTLTARIAGWPGGSLRCGSTVGTYIFTARPRGVATTITSSALLDINMSENKRHNPRIGGQKASIGELRWTKRWIVVVNWMMSRTADPPARQASGVQLQPHLGTASPCTLTSDKRKNPATSSRFSSDLISIKRCKANFAVEKQSIKQALRAWWIVKGHTFLFLSHCAMFTPLRWSQN